MKFLAILGCCCLMCSPAFYVRAQNSGAIAPVQVGSISNFYNFGNAVVHSHYLFAANNGAPPYSGLYIYDISRPATPVDVGFNDGQGYALRVMVSGAYAYVLYTTSLRIFDISNPNLPVGVGQIPAASQTLAVSQGRAYLDGLIYDVSNPANPVKVGQIPSGYNGIAASSNYVYLADPYNGLRIYDVSDAGNPKQVAQPATNPEGWHWASDVTLSGDYAYLATFTNLGLATFNVAVPTNPVTVCNVETDANHVAVYGNFAYAIAFDVWVYDVSNPTNGIAAGTIPCWPVFNPYSVAAFGNYVYLAGWDGIRVYYLGVVPPSISVAPRGRDSLTLAWPTPTGSFAVQQSTDLNRAQWTTLTSASVVVGSQNQVTIPIPHDTMFYRLVSQ